MKSAATAFIATLLVLASSSATPQTAPRWTAYNVDPQTIRALNDKVRLIEMAESFANPVASSDRSLPANVIGMGSQSATKSSRFSWREIWG